MTPETETASPAAGINVWDRSDATITLFYDTTIESSARNRGRGFGQLSYTIRGRHQVHYRKCGRINRPE